MTGCRPVRRQSNVSNADRSAVTLRDGSGGLLVAASGQILMPADAAARRHENTAELDDAAEFVSISSE